MKQVSYLTLLHFYSHSHYYTRSYSTVTLFISVVLMTSRVMAQCSSSQVANQATLQTCLDAIETGS